MIFENDNPRKNRVTNPTPYSGLGKLPPQATELEELVLGGLLLERVNNNIWALLRPEMFYKDNHQTICRALFELREAKTPIDLGTVRNQLRKTGKLEEIGGAYYLTELTSNVASVANMEYHIAIIHEKFLSRSLIGLAHNLSQNCYEDTSNPLHEIGVLVAALNNLKKGIFKRTDKTIKELLIEARTARQKPHKGGLIGISTGSKGLDYITEGYQGNQLIIIAGRPGMAKTAEMCSQIVSIGFREEASNKLEEIPVAGFSLEMSNISLVNRVLSNVSSIHTTKIKKNTLTEQENERLDYYEGRLSTSPIFLDDTPGLTINEFEAKAALLVATHGVRVIFIDYLQLMLGDPTKKYQSREAEVADISRRLKVVAKELDITIVALCQLSREVEKRKLNIPVLSDLRESGSIEQDADVVIFLWRPEYYQELMESLKELDIRLFDFKLTEFNGLIVNIVAKCRDEATGKVPLKFDGKTMRVYDHPQVLDSLLKIESGQQQLTPNTGIQVDF